MNEEERKYWEALVNASKTGHGHDEIPGWGDVDAAILAADAELTRLREAVEWAISVVDEVASKMTDKPALYHDNKAAWKMMGVELRRRASGEGRGK